MSFDSWDNGPWFDISRYGPESFSDDDERDARRAGYPSAQEKWAADMAFKDFAHRHDSHKPRVDAQVRMDLESAGVPWDKIGALAEASNNILRDQEYENPTEFRAPKDDLMRDAAVQGVVNRAVRLFDQIEARGHSLDMDPQEMDADDRAWAAYYEQEAREIADRLDAYQGPSFDRVVSDWSSGEIEYRERFDGEPVPDDLELREVYEAYDRDVEAWHRDHPEAVTRADDDWSDVGWDETEGGSDDNS